MGTRLALHQALIDLMIANVGIENLDPSCKNVYYQIPETVKMHYPAIVYSRSGIQNEDADNDKYLVNKSYQVTYIDRNPDATMVDALNSFPYSRYVSHTVYDNLNHDTFEIFY